MLYEKNNYVKNMDVRKDVLIAIAFFLFCLVFAVKSLYPRFRDEAKYNELKENGCWTLGEYENIYQRGGMKGSDTYYAYGTYTVDGQTYEFEFSTKSKVADVGKIKIYYDEENPSDYVQESYFGGDSVVGFIFLGLALVTATLEILVCFKSKKDDESNSYNADTSTEEFWKYGKGADVNFKNVDYYGNSQNTKQCESKGNVGNTAFYKRKK